MQLYLPDDLYELVKARGLAASELLQNAVRAEVRRLDLLAKTDDYVAQLEAQVGRPSAKERDRAAAIAAQLDRRSTPKAG